MTPMQATIAGTRDAIMDVLRIRSEESGYLALLQALQQAIQAEIVRVAVSGAPHTSLYVRPNMASLVAGVRDREGRSP